MSGTAEAVTEVAKLVREMVAMMRSLGGVVTQVRAHNTRRRNRRAAADLYGIAFTPGGMLDLLEKLSSLEAAIHMAETEEEEERLSDLEDELMKSIERKLRNSPERVEKHIERLREYTNHLREMGGFQAALEFESLLFGESIGKEGIRHGILGLINDFKAHPEKSSYGAALIVERIERLNKELAKFHDYIMSENSRKANKGHSKDNIKAKKMPARKRVDVGE